MSKQIRRVVKHYKINHGYKVICEVYRDQIKKYKDLIEDHQEKLSKIEAEFKAYREDYRKRERS